MLLPSDFNNGLIICYAKAAIPQFGNGNQRLTVYYPIAYTTNPIVVFTQNNHDYFYSSENGIQLDTQTTYFVYFKYNHNVTTPAHNIYYIVIGH